MTTRQRKGSAKATAGAANEGSAGDATEGPKSSNKAFKGRYNPKLGKRPEHTANHTVLPHSVWARIVMICSIVIIIYYSSGGEKITAIAKQSERLEKKRFHNNLCAPSFKKEIEALGNKECLPTKCGRVVMDDLLTDTETHGLLELAKKGLEKGGSNGGASILDLHSGALSKGDQFVNLYEAFPDVYTEQEFDVYKTSKAKVKAAIADHFGISESSLYLSHPTFFSRITAKPAKTLHDEYWHVHVDKETYPSFHYTSLLYLTDYNVDFKGGRFIFVDNHDKMNRTIEPRNGRVSAFTSGPENKHHVEKVTDGVRFALTMGFTCDKTKAIPDPGLKPKT